jgi:hypothetical protein
METKSTDGPSNKKSRGGWWVTIVVAVVVTALVFVGGAAATGFLSARGRGGEGGRPFGQRPNFQLEAAKELPTSAPNVRGVLTKRTDNTLTVGVRNGFPDGGGGNGAAQIVDVVVAGDTAIYHDVTQMDFGGQPPSGPIQQKVEPGSLAGINTNSRITVWGEQNGNQIAAKVLVYSDPMTFQRSQP